ncbi:serine/threonine-protein kinase haspin homolog [Galendromus occidentalis]|uniref:Serine/threonine-protein kinase haspin homolog n=1 Tax=Galendromus occidentalis TaxID=34638 RepID=A0AAJ6QUG8_9ACAR|nr:serine/threonine-protein kinase haspin homolog [Galendromus occidentalis]
MSSILNNSKLSVLQRRKTLAEVNHSSVQENESPPKRRRRSDTQLSELYMSHLRDASQLRVVAERMSWLKLAPLIMPEYPVDFEYIFKNWGMEIVSKLGEGSFSEVYRVRTRFNGENDFDVFKLIPVGQPGQPAFDHMLPEMSMCLAGRCLLESPRHRAPSFLSLRGTHLVQGQQTEDMIYAYEAFRRKCPQETEQPHPLDRPKNQFYVVFYTSYDGCELETELPKLSGDIRASIVLQVTYALAAAEQSFEFEHRDLHLSNVVLKDCDESDLEFRISGNRFRIKSFGKRAAVIDYGMCRLVVDEALHSTFEPEILVGPGMQRWTYREQHRMLGGNYENRCLETNGLWIRFIIRKLFKKRPISAKVFYAAQINRLYSELCENHLSARRCVEILENCELNQTLSI